METILLTQAKVRELYDIDTNMNSTQFNQYALRVQRNSLKSTLGTTLYNDITATTPSQDYSALLDPYIENYLAAAFIAKYTIEGSLFHTNTGNFQFANDTTQGAAKWQLQQVSENYKAEQQTYANEMIEYLNDNSSTYPLWGNETSESTSFSFSIV